jgi:hypothetical protein
MKIKSLKNKDYVSNLYDMLIKSEQDFVLSISRKTLKIEFKDITYTQLETFQSNLFFSSFNKIKSDIQNGNFLIDLTEEQMQKIKYYSLNQKKIVSQIDKCYQIDINSAYPKTLLNLGIISKQTFDYMFKIPKIDRLASIGMLAGKKDVFNFKKGLLSDSNIIKSEYSNFFFLCVFIISEIMINISESFNGFLFHWVDAIYISNYSQALEIQKLLLSKGYESKIKELINFSCITKQNCFNIKFQEKDGGDKIFNIPITNGFIKDFESLLINKNKSKWNCKG